MEIGETENRPQFYINIIITQALCVVIVILCVLSFKFFSKSEYKKFTDFYKKEICADTNISEVLE